MGYALLVYSQIYCLLDEWCELTMDDIREFENKIKEELDKVLFFRMPNI